MYVWLIFTNECQLYLYILKHNSKNTFCNAVNPNLVHILHIHTVEHVKHVVIIYTVFISTHADLHRSNFEWEMIFNYFFLPAMGIFSWCSTNNALNGEWHPRLEEKCLKLPSSVSLSLHSLLFRRSSSPVSKKTGYQMAFILMSLSYPESILATYFHIMKWILATVE